MEVARRRLQRREVATAALALARVAPLADHGARALPVIVAAAPLLELVGRRDVWLLQPELLLLLKELLLEELLLELLLLHEVWRRGAWRGECGRIMGLGPGRAEGLGLQDLHLAGDVHVMVAGVVMG